MSVIQFKFRRGTAAQWTASNPVLGDGEMGIESDTGQFKLGNGVASWNARPYGGIQGPIGLTGNTGNTGNTGATGNKGWSPVLAVVTDSLRRVFQITDWVGGEGTKPSTTNQFIGPTGIVATAAAAVDIRGAQGPAGADLTSRLLTAGDGLTGGGDLSADRTFAVNVDNSSLEIIADIVRAKADGITNTHLAPMGALTIKGNNTGGSAGPSNLTAAQATAMLDTATTSLKGLFLSSEKIKLAGIWKDIVADFGADPTGVVDCTTIITNAIASFGTNGVLYFPPGTYKISGNISVSKCILFIGAGRSITNITTTHATTTMFTFTTGSQGAGFEQMRLTGSTNVLRTAGYAVDFGNIANAYIQQCDFLFHHQNVRSAGALQFIDDANIREFGNNASGGSAVYVTGAGDRYFRRVTTDNGEDETGAAGIRIDQCSSVVITDCNLINSTNTLDLVPGDGLVVASVMAINTFFDSSVIGVNVAGHVNGTTHRVRFSSCWFSTHTAAGVRLNNKWLNSVDFVGCDFHQNPVGVDVLAATEWSVRSSRLCGNTTCAIRVVIGDGAASTHGFSLSDNFVGNGAGFGANGKGIQIGAGVYNRYQILDNRGLETNTIKGIDDLGTVDINLGQKNVANNMGALLKGSLVNGRGAVTSGATETLLMRVRVPANGVAVGQQLQVIAGGQSSSTGTLIFRLRAGALGTTGDTQIWISTTSAAQVANAWAMIDAIATIVALGATGNVSGQGRVQAQAILLGTITGAEVIANAPTTADWFLSLTCTCSVGTFTLRHGAISSI